MGDDLETPPYIKKNLSPLIYQPCHLTKESYWVDQAGFPIHKLMITASNHLLVLNMFGKGSQDDVIHHLPWTEVQVTGQ